MTHCAHPSEVPEEEGHPLTLLWGTWEIWCDIPQRQPSHATEQANWLDQVKSIGLFDSAEGFWGIFNCTILPSQLPPNASFYLFRKHIAPMWEHEANRRGGKWVISFAGKSARTDSEMQPVDVAWQTLCLCAIGELFPGAEEEICGVTVSRGKQRTSPSGHATSAASEWKLCVWTRSASDEAGQLAIADFIYKQLHAQSNSRDASEDAQQQLTTGGCEAAGTPSRLAQTKPRESTGLPSSITYVAHRELMEAKQEFVKGSSSKPAQAFQPKYTLTAEAARH